MSFFFVYFNFQVWYSQNENYNKLMEYINSHSQFFLCLLIKRYYKIRKNIWYILQFFYFRYDSGKEWDLQYENYDRLMTYINSHPELNAEVQFGTLVIFCLLIKKENLTILNYFILSILGWLFQFCQCGFKEFELSQKRGSWTFLSNFEWGLFHLRWPGWPLLVWYVLDT